MQATLSPPLRSRSTMEGGGIGSDDVGGDGLQENETEVDERAALLKDRFRLSVISIATAEAKKVNVEIAEPVVACVADLAFKYTEQLAKDVELFSQHAGRKSVKVEDVILSAHRNAHLASLLRSFYQELKGKEPQTERKRKKSSKMDDKTILN
ncbi:MHF histone-fold complex subunit 1 isoform X2 [Canna indica]|uniref:MHF histone-fold complex subunit 1 isoform X2 n=1 Tax=Canna indica TaxID=4628 RepID=A0AAQ3K607_9LILI|nr:MHF histone-fold complex subunit 1 isoform X2 [Canna indica]